MDFRRRRRSGARPCPKNSVTMAVLPLSVMLFLVACAVAILPVPSCTCPPPVAPASPRSLASD